MNAINRPQGYEATARRIAAVRCHEQFWAPKELRRFMKACRIARLDPLALLAEAREVTA